MKNTITAINIYIRNIEDEKNMICKKCFRVLSPDIVEHTLLPRTIHFEAGKVK